VFSLQLIRLIIMGIKVLRYSYQKMNSLRDILHFKIVKMCELSQFLSQRVLNQKEFYCNVLKSSQD